MIWFKEGKWWRVREVGCQSAKLRRCLGTRLRYHKSLFINGLQIVPFRSAKVPRATEIASLHSLHPRTHPNRLALHALQCNGEMMQRHGPFGVPNNAVAPRR